MPPCTRKTGRAVDHAKSLLSEHFAQLINFCDKNHIVDMDKWQQDHLSQDSELLARKYGSYGRVYIVKQGGKTVAYKVLRLQCDPYFSLPHISRGISELLTVINELRIQRAVSGIPGFAKLLKAHVVAGELPELFLEAEEETLAWAGEGWFEAGFPADSPLWLTQVFLVTSMEYAGEGSKAHIFLDGQNTVKQVKDITALGAALLGQIEALAEGEIRCEFMHNDLYLGNACMQERIVPPKEGQLGAKPMFKVTVIDYGRSRIRHKSEIVACSMKNCGVTMKNGGIKAEFEKSYGALSEEQLDFIPKLNMMFLCDQAWQAKAALNSRYATQLHENASRYLEDASRETGQGINRRIDEVTLRLITFLEDAREHKRYTSVEELRQELCRRGVCTEAQLRASVSAD